MMLEMDIYGVFLPTLFVLGLVAMAVTFVVRRLLTAFRVYRIVWHRSLFDLALFVVVLGGVVHFYGLLFNFPVPGQ